MAIKHIESAAQAKSALKRIVGADGKIKEELLTYGAYIAEQSLTHGNKQPFQMAESSGLTKWAVAALKRCILPQNVEYRDDRDAGRQVADAHAEKIVSIVLDKQQDNSEAAQKRRADAKKKREDEKARVAKLEKENAQFKADGRKLPAKGVKVDSKGGAIVDPAGKVVLTMSEDEYRAVVAMLKQSRKPAPKAVEQQAATA